MTELLVRVAYHFLSSALVGSLALAWISSTGSRSSRPARGGFTSSISSRQWCSLLVLSVWTHIFADVLEHGSLPKIADGLTGALAALLGLL